MAIHLEPFADRLALMLRKVTDQRFGEICAVHPELLEQRENVVVWQQEIPGNPMETRYVITLNGNEVAKFSVRTEMNNMTFKIGVSDVQYCSRK